LFLPMFGEHNVQNSLTVLAVAEEMGLGDEVVRASLSGFKGVRRRFTKTGEWNGVTIIDDYGHHPVEIAAVLKAARAIALLDDKGGNERGGDGRGGDGKGSADRGGGRVIAIVQPHRYTRLANLFDGFCTCFNDADLVLVADVYPAGEAPIAGVSRDALVAGLSAHGHRNAQPLPGPESLAPLLRSLVRPDDIVVCLGAGSITNWANSLPLDLAELDARSRVA
jgi:UDP-N-acetylmuramate--alanine ligase